MVIKMGRGLSLLKRCSAFLTPHSKKQVLQALVLSNPDFCPVMWSSAARKYLVKLQLAQNSAARFALHYSQRADINAMLASLSWPRVEERLTASLFIFIRNINVLKITNCLHSKLTHSSETHTYRTRHATRGLFTAPISRTNSRKHTVLSFAWNFLPPHIAQMNSTPGFKKQTKQHLVAQRLSPI